MSSSDLRGTTPIPTAHGEVLTVDALLRRAARKHGDRIALQCEDGERSFADLDAQASSLAEALVRHGIKPGDRVAIVMRNRLEFVESLFGIIRAGAVAVTVNFRLTGPETAHILIDSGAVAVITEPGCERQITEATGVAPTVRTTLVVDRKPGVTDALDYDAELAASSGDLPPAPPRDEWSPACILYTSGTTGRPKGAVLTHRGLVTQASDRASAHRLAAVDEVWFTGVQLFHVTGITAVLAAVSLGAELVFLARGGVTAAEIAEQVERLRVTTLSLVPTQLKQLVDLPDLRDRDFALRRISWGSAPAELTVLRRLHEAFGDLELMTAYGQTECGGFATVLSGAEAITYLGAVGRPLPSTELRIVDSTMNDVPVGDVGEIVLRSPSVMAGYWANDRATAEAFEGGWLHTGDLGRTDEAGVCWVVGRKKDLIISGGENIYPAEIEAVIAGHPRVSDVAVVGRPHPRWGETPVAFVVPADESMPPTYDEILNHVSSRLASYKRPADLVLVSSLPRGATGKVQKFRLTQAALADTP